MNLPTLQNGMVIMPQDEFEQLLEQLQKARSGRWPMSIWKAMMQPTTFVSFVIYWMLSTLPSTPRGRPSSRF